MQVNFITILLFVWCVIIKTHGGSVTFFSTLAQFNDLEASHC